MQAILLHIQLQGISPKIWRRVLVPIQTSLLELHYIVQIAFDWSDDRQHRFHIQGKDYGQYREGGLWYRDDPSKVKLDSFSFRRNDKFTYVYSFFEYWQHILRVEKICSVEEGTLPSCVDGAWKSPPEGCGGPLAFLELKKQYSEGHIYYRYMEILSEIIDENGDDKSSMLDERKRELEVLNYWSHRDKIDLNEINERLQQYGRGVEPWDLIECIENRAMLW